MAKRVRSGVFLALLLAVFLGIFAVFGPGVYNDSDQYLKMHIHREPLYPLFLAALRTVFPNGWLIAMGVFQNIFAAVSIWLFVEYTSKRFELGFMGKAVVTLLCLAPHMLTSYFSALHLFITNSVMSEALCMPLFLLFFMECCKIFTEREERECWKAMVCSLFLAFLVSLARTQMMVTILIWLVVTGARIVLWPKKRWRRRTWQRPRNRDWKVLRLLMVVAVVVVVFILRMFAVRSYNLVFNGRFINNTYGTVNTLTNILYAADREDGERIRDPEAREFFFRMYDLAEEQQANYKYAGSSLRDKTEHIEAWHDTIKYEMIEDVFYQTYDKTVTSDYITQNLMADKTAGETARLLFPVAGKLFSDCFLWSSSQHCRSSSSDQLGGGFHLFVSFGACIFCLAEG